MSTTQTFYQCETLADIANKNYEYRSANQHEKICELLQQFFPTLSAKIVKLLSFYVKKIEAPVIIGCKQYNRHSFVFVNLSQNNPEQSVKMERVTRDAKIDIQEHQQAIFLDYQHYLSCITLGETSIQEEIAFMNSSEFLCSLPRKRLYYLLRNCRILPFTTSQCVYHEGQTIEPGQSGSGVYFVRKGDFGYFKASKKQGKQIETLRFTKGHLFGTLQIVNNRDNIQLNRAFTVKCKSHQAIIFNFSEETFMNHIKPYCEQYLNQRQGKLVKYLDEQIQKIKISRNSNTNFLAQTLTRRFSVGDNTSFKRKETQLPILNRTKMSVPLQNNTFRTTVSQQIQNQGLKNSSYESLLKDGPLKKYPLPSQRSTFTESQFRDLTRLERNKQQCEKLKQLKTQKCTSARGQILFSFFKQTWKFQKQKKMRNYRYQ